MAMRVPAVTVVPEIVIGTTVAGSFVVPSSSQNSRARVEERTATEKSKPPNPELEGVPAVSDPPLSVKTSDWSLLPL